MFAQFENINRKCVLSYILWSIAINDSVNNLIKRTKKLFFFWPKSNDLIEETGKNYLLLDNIIKLPKKLPIFLNSKLIKIP